ncbi:MAG: hypothetical protein C4527_15190 [Candidatus Omnitrophota bacterium]|jgi:hypothetical protein|nr:MAG: hypothetical protein C4527_15190 [Candidatus Omnitrophota bacterium]
MDKKHRERYLTLAAIICICALAGDKLVLTPLTNLWRERAQKIEELENNVNKGELLLEREANLRQRWQQMKAEALPADRPVAENQILTAVERWVQESRIQRSSFKPDWKQNDPNYSTLECQVIAQGDISALSRFLYEIERDSLALKVENIEISARDDKGESLSLGVRFSGLILADTN